MEHMKDQVKQVAEGHSVLNNKIDRTREELGEKIDRVDEKVDVIHDTLKGRIKKVETKVGV